MLHYAPAFRFSSPLSYPQPPLNNPRDRYFAALAEAEAAEAEYLAAEAVQREEEALRRRLEEIQLRKQEEDLYLRSRYGRTPYALNLQAPTTYGTYPGYVRDNLAILRHQLDREERLRFLAQMEAEAEVRHQAEEIRRKHQEKATCLLLQQERERAHVATFPERHAKVRQCGPRDAGHQPHCHRHVHVSNQPSSQSLVLHPSLQSLLGPYTTVTATKKPAPVRPKPAQPSFEEEGEVIGELLKQLLSVKPTFNPPAPAPDAAPTPVQPAATKPELSLAEGIQQASNFFLGNPQKVDALAPFISLFDQNVGFKSDTAASKDRVSFDGVAMLQQFVDWFTPPASATAKQPSNAQASGSESSSKPSSSTAAPIVNSAPVPSSIPKTSPSIEETLKQQLEARLNSEYSSEVRDTIQAIIASLKDSITSSSASIKAESSKSKGKGKATEAPAEAASTHAAPRSKDIFNSMNDVRSIDAAFQALSADFTFPSTLDFLAAHPVPGSPISSGSESSATVHLAYTSRNHPVRFYEQALSALLTQLDAVQSFGNDDLRNMRREVVTRVERALEELEAEIDGRWRTRFSKEAKAANIEVTDTVVATTEPVTASEPIPSAEATATTPELKADVAEPAPPVDEPSTPSPTLEAATTVSQIASDSAAAAYPPSPSEAPSESSLTDSAVSIVTPNTPSGTTDATIVPSPSLAAFVVTIKGYDVEGPADASPASESSESPESGDEFLLASADTDAPKRPNNKDNEDTGSDWSEVEA